MPIPEDVWTWILDPADEPVTIHEFDYPSTRGDLELAYTPVTPDISITPTMPLAPTRTVSIEPTYTVPEPPAPGIQQPPTPRLAHPSEREEQERRRRAETYGIILDETTPDSIREILARQELEDILAETGGRLPEGYGIILPPPEGTGILLPGTPRLPAGAQPPTPPGQLLRGGGGTNVPAIEPLGELAWWPSADAIQPLLRGWAGWLKELVEQNRLTRPVPNPFVLEEEAEAAGEEIPVRGPVMPGFESSQDVIRNLQQLLGLEFTEEDTPTSKWQKVINAIPQADFAAQQELASLRFDPNAGQWYSVDISQLTHPAYLRAG